MNTLHYLAFRLEEANENFLETLHTHTVEKLVEN